MDWEDFRYLLAIARAGSLLGAARQLKVDQATVSRRLKAMEKRSGVVLFLRSKAALKPTEPGEMLIGHAERMEQEVLAATDRVDTYDQAPRGLVRIATMPWIINLILIPNMPAFVERYPGIEIQTIAGLRERNLGKRETELALRFEMQPRGREVVIGIADFCYALYAPANRDAEDLPWVTFWEDFHHFAPAKWLEERPDPTRQIRLRANDAGSVHCAIRAGLGKGLLPEVLGEADPSLVRLSGPDPELVRHLRILVHSDLQKITRVKAVIEWLTDTCKSHSQVSKPRLVS